MNAAALYLECTALRLTANKRLFTMHTYQLRTIMH